MLHIHHTNLQHITGGGEVYTHALTRAFADAGARVTLYCHPSNRLWDDLPGERISLVRVADQAGLLASLPAANALVLTQSPLDADCVTELIARHRVAAFAHMPITAGRSADFFKRCRVAITVSRYCIGLLRRAGVEQVYPEPMYGTAEAQRGDGRAVIARSPYAWDKNKFRDVLLGYLEPLVEPFRLRPAFEKPPGLTLGVVSLLSTIKQFPELFSLLAPVLASRSSVRVEIFGNGGYAQVRDIRHALAPLAERARFWGYQQNVRDIYPQLDYLLTGLPEKEALGLNVLEAQMYGTPVLAVDAPPFTETVLEGGSGFRYRDPRQDSGADFARVLDRILAGNIRPDPRAAAAEHLQQFSYAALVERTRPLLAHLQALAAA